MFEVDGIYFKQKNNYLIVAGVAELIKSDIVIPTEINGQPVKEVDSYAFQNVDELDSISFSGEIEIIGKSAFRNCKNLKMVCFLSNKKHTIKIHEMAFADCNKLTTISGSVNIYLDGEYIFHNCRSMTKTPAQIRGIIPVGTYAGCTNLSILLFHKVHHVQMAAFLDCKNVKKLFIMNDFEYPTDFWDGWNDVTIICRNDSKFLELAYLGYNISSFHAMKAYST